MAWLAELKTDQNDASARDAARRQLRLNVPAIAGPATTRVLIHNISTTGLLVESSEDIPVSEVIEVELPEIGMTAARVVWSSDNFFGCQFEAPVPTSVVSASQLRSPPGPRLEEAVAALPDIEPASTLDVAAAAEGDRSELSARAKLAIIVGLSAGLWGMILAAAAQLG